MIKVKLTSSGGYICGDGPIPGGLNPDEFYKMFAVRIIEAQAQGLKELEIPEEEVERMITSVCVKVCDEVDAAPTYEFNDDIPVGQLFDHQRQIIEDMKNRGQLRIEA